MKFKQFSLLALVLWAQAAINLVAAQTAVNTPVTPSSPSSAAIAASAAGGSESKAIHDWLLRMHESSRKRAYIGTYVVSSGGSMSAAKIWHVCEGNQQIERVETLTGAPRSIFRHNDKIVTFMPEQKVVRTEKRESIATFPDLIQSADSRIADFYSLKPEGVERIAGLEADVVVLLPKDNLRYGYRVWTEQKKGLVVKLQTLDAGGQVLEQAAFSELQLDAPVKMDKLMQMMSKVDGYRAEQPVLVKTTAGAEGWALKAAVAGFKPVSCYKRPSSTSTNTPAVAGSGNSDEPMQWIFSDGLAAVSLFVEPFDRQRHGKESSMAMGATQSMSRQVGAHWLTVMGEVPAQTLRLFANSLERRKN
jgi:sigma-E factor negative regulatory protein RseB